MSPALDGSSAIRCFECSDVIKIHYRIIFNFYTGLPHFSFILFCSILGYIPPFSILHTVLLLLCNGPWAYSVIQYVPKDCMSPSLDTLCGTYAIFTFRKIITQLWTSHLVYASEQLCINWFVAWQVVNENYFHRVWCHRIQQLSGFSAERAKETASVR